MNPLDVVLVAVVLLSTALGAWRGLLREVIGIVGVIAALLASYLLTPVVMPMFGGEFGMLAYVIVSVAIFLAGMVAVTAVGWILGRMVRALHLGGVDRLLGGFFGLVRAGALTVATFTLLVLLLEPGHPLMAGSRLLDLEAPAVYWVGSRLPHERARTEFLDRWDDLAHHRGWDRDYWVGASSGAVPGTSGSESPKAALRR